MAKYLKKPIPVDAWQIDLLEIANQGAYPEFVDLALKTHTITMKNPHTLSIITLEGVMSASEGDYLVKGPKGEHWFVKKSIFEETYEEYNENPIQLRGGTIDSVQWVENEDGSANIIMDMDEDIKDFFAAEGLKRVLMEAVTKLAKEHGVE